MSLPISLGERTGAGTKESALILVVDDDFDSIESLGLLIASAGFRFVGATGGAQALAICREHRPDLAVVDVMMPGMTGFELCELLRSEAACRDIPIIINSAHETHSYSHAGLYELAFVKPVEPDDLFRAIRSLVPADKLPR